MAHAPMPAQLQIFKKQILFGGEIPPLFDTRDQ